VTPDLVRWAPGLLACAGLLATLTPARAQSPADALSGAAALASPAEANTATAPAAAVSPRARPRPVKADPFEGFNRGVFAFNEVVDHALLKPLAMAYKAAVPSPLRTGVDNVFGNVGDAWSAVNLLLQGKGKPALEMTVRVTTNTVFGIGGLFDLASDAGLERQSEDFGQTLGKWGLGAGPYLVLPFYGASSLRDAVGLPLDRKASLPGVVHDGAYRWGLTTLELVHGRADLLSATNLLDQVALDKYSFVRDSYLARRRNQVFDGNPPEEPPDEEPLAPLGAPAGPDATVRTPAAPPPPPAPTR
jgi:phospholipid-binding lipoprotein MlaA